MKKALIVPSIIILASFCCSPAVRPSFVSGEVSQLVRLKGTVTAFMWETGTR